MEWRRDINDLSEELTALDARIDAQQKKVDAQPKKKKKWTEDQISLGLDKDARREAVQLDSWRAERKAYAEYVAIIWRLLDLKPADFDPGKFKMTELIPPKSLGPLNSIWDLRHYVTGRAPAGWCFARTARSIGTGASRPWIISPRCVRFRCAITSKPESRRSRWTSSPCASPIAMRSWFGATTRTRL